MSIRFPDCPHLPTPRAHMDWRDVAGHGENRDADFYATVLEYGHFLWRRGQSARAILCLDRALGADLRGDEAVLRAWPLPYAAMRWFLQHTPPDVFMGNPRVHFQHYAGRMNEPRREQRRWRAWACWALARAILPHLPGDPKHVIEEPSHALIREKLLQHGHPGEADLWQAEMENAGRNDRRAS
jgi:hypothetical protein